ncbi:MAG: D-alanyl-D-alanine carboxypeptidase [Firmicutes bacterium]|nr:D-alanyl-D-alanine carboxypeptidase [Bacillota bacterium]
MKRKNIVSFLLVLVMCAAVIGGGNFDIRRGERQAFREINCNGQYVYAASAGVASQSARYASVHGSGKFNYLDNTIIESSARGSAVIEITTGQVLYSHNGTKVLPMASTTKILTALVVIENVKNLDEVLTTHPKAVGIEGSSAYLQQGEKLTVRDVLYGLMLVSGNDCAYALAIHTAGSVEKFSEMMNESARRAGATNSNFTNPHGLHCDNHYTTPIDLAKISAAAMQNDTFKQIASTKQHKAPWQDRTYPRVFNNKNKLLRLYDGADGVKTGFTKKSGRCLVSSATREGLEIAVVVLNCGDMWEESIRLLDKAFANFELNTILRANTSTGELAVKNGKRGVIQTYTKESFTLPQKKDAPLNIQLKKNFKKVSAPVKINQKVGTLSVYKNEQQIFETNIYSLEEVKQEKTTKRLFGCKFIA